MDNRYVGFLIIGITGLIGFIIYSFNQALTDIVDSACSHGSECPMWGTLYFQNNVSIALMIFVAIIGFYLIFFSKNDEKMPESIRKMPKPDGLTGEDNKVFEVIVESEGSILQSKLVEKTGLGKVKITRVLNRLEGKGIVERKRRGMTNVVILKHK